MNNKKVDYIKLLKRGILILLLVVIVGLFVANSYVKKYGYSNLGDLVSTYWSNSKLADKVEPIQMKIDISDEDFEFIESKREEALKRGVQINIGDNYVPCEIEVDGVKTEGEIRLKGHMTDHLEGDKWSYRVKTKTPVLGMYRFSLQHPGTRNYVYEWVYHQLLAQEGVIHLNYDFINVQLRENDLGIYAIEEHFGQHVLEHNNRTKGAILRWNPGLYWEWRIDELHNIYLDEEYSAYSSSFVEPYDKGVVKKDPELIENYLQGAKILEAFRRDSLKASEVFDVELMARFHAIIDLVGGYHSLDWSDVKFYYNNESKRIEPIGYESFSVRETEKIAGQRIPNSYLEIETNYHDKLFADPVFFKAYIENLERICDEEYFNAFRLSIQEKLNEKIGLVSKEWPYRKFTFDPYYRNIELIRNNINLPKPFHAFLNAYTDSTLELSLAAVSDFPIELVSLEINEKEIIPFDDLILLPKSRNDFIEYQSVVLKHSAKKIKDLLISCRIPGSQNLFIIEVNEYPSYTSEFNHVNEDTLVSVLQHPNIEYSKFEEVYFFNTNSIKVDRPFKIDSTIALRILPGQEIRFEDEGAFHVSGILQMKGAVDKEILLNSENRNACIILNNTQFEGNNIVFINCYEVFRAENSTLRLSNFVGADISGSLVFASRSSVYLSQANLGSVNNIADLGQSKLFVDGLTATFGEICYRAKGSVVDIRSSSFKTYSSFCDADHISTLGIWSSEILDFDNLGALNNGSAFNTYGGKVEWKSNSFTLDKSSYELLAASTLSFYKTDTLKTNK